MFFTKGQLLAFYKAALFEQMMRLSRFEHYQIVKRDIGLGALVRLERM